MTKTNTLSNGEQVEALTWRDLREAINKLPEELLDTCPEVYSCSDGLGYGNMCFVFTPDDNEHYKNELKDPSTYKPLPIGVWLD